MERVRYDACPDATSRKLLYSARMKFLKSREGGKRGKRQTFRRKSSLDLFDFGGTSENEEVQFSVLKIKQPISSDLLEPPQELMTRQRSFKRAYWKHHAKEARTSVEELGLQHVDERKEMLNRKREEIRAKLREKERVRREEDLRKRANRVLNREAGIESDDEEEEEDEDSELEDQIGMMSLSPANSSPGGRKLRASLAVMPNNGPDEAPKAEDESGAEDSFSFLTEWSSAPKEKIRW